MTPKPGQLIGTVKATDTFTVLVGYRVFINGPEQRETFTNEQGQYVFAGLTPGNYTISINAPVGSGSIYSPYMASDIVIKSEGVTTRDVYLNLVKQSLGGFIFGMDLAHSFMALAFFITIVILTIAVYLRLKRIQPEGGSDQRKDIVEPGIEEDDLDEQEEKEEEEEQRA